MHLLRYTALADTTVLFLLGQRSTHTNLGYEHLLNGTTLLFVMSGRTSLFMHTTRLNGEMIVQKRPVELHLNVDHGFGVIDDSLSPRGKKST